MAASSFTHADSAGSERIGNTHDAQQNAAFCPHTSVLAPDARQGISIRADRSTPAFTSMSRLPHSRGLAGDDAGNASPGLSDLNASTAGGSEAGQPVGPRIWSLLRRWGAPTGAPPRRRPRTMLRVASHGIYVP